MAYKNDWRQQYESKYQALNPQQKVAVDTIEGPVMVLAGPGTGKTQILSFRIANILIQQDISPTNILCLTYTEAGATAMRKRLRSLIGPDAQKLHIYTFHSFCSYLMNAYAEYFAKTEIKIAEEIDIIQLIDSLLVKLGPDSPLTKNANTKYGTEALQKIKSVFDYLSKSNISKADLESSIEKSKTLMRQEPSMYYKKNVNGNKVGDYKIKEEQKNIQKYDNFMAVVDLYPEFKKLKAENLFFEYEDLIQNVINALSENEDFLFDCKEQFQYILVDEFQDTNGSQKTILELLTSEDDNPNIFVVGDDDQSIFSFQGADISNFEWFIQRFSESVTCVVLKNNYRSSQMILDGAKQVIGFNQNRVANRDEQFHKDIVAEGKFKELSLNPHVLSFENEFCEEIFIIDEIKKLISQGVSPSKIAILYTKHKFVERIQKYMERAQIPYETASESDILKLPIIQKIFNLIQLITFDLNTPSESITLSLFEYFHLPQLGISLPTLGQILVKFQGEYRQSHSYPNLLNTILENSNIESISTDQQKALQDAIELLKSWREQNLSNTPGTMLDIILRDTQLFSNVLRQEDKLFQYNAIVTLHNWLKKELENGRISTLGDFLNLYETYKEKDLKVSMKHAIHKSEGVQLRTVFASKGLEYEYVFLINSQKANWENKRVRPEYINPITNPFVPEGEKEDRDVEEERRLFYVAITRAEKSFTCSYHKSSTEGDRERLELVPSKFALELIQGDESKIQSPDVSTDRLEQYIDYTRYVPKVKDGIHIDLDTLREKMEFFKWNNSALEAYLTCPNKFYFEKILRIPMTLKAHLAYGNAIHGALQDYFDKLKATENLPHADELYAFFNAQMEKRHYQFTKAQMNDFSAQGLFVLAEFYKQNHNSWGNIPAFYTELKLEGNWKGLAISGIVDRVDIYGNQVQVWDYKTGKVEAKDLKLPTDLENPGGDKGRQLVFYKMLMEQDHRFKNKEYTGIMQSLRLENEKFAKYEKQVNDDDADNLGQILIEVDAKVKSGDFSRMCNKFDCEWCTFIKNYDLNETK
jgi:DNA helicase-2/ATP-dependent DNA helicase PcrA